MLRAAAGRAAARRCGRRGAAVGTDEEIARAAKMLPIAELAEKRLRIPPEELEPYGRYKAKVPLNYLDSLPSRDSKLVLVTAITPTKAGEGKTTTSVGLTDGMNKLGKDAMVALREPSLGPVFGMKGGAAGGGYAQVVPMDDINLHFTGDFHAIGAAHNLLSAMADNHIFWQKEPKLDTRFVNWRRVVDMNDRALRNITLGLGDGNGYAREGGYDITVASEVMACLCLATGMDDLRRRLGSVVVGYTRGTLKTRKPVRASDINADGAMAVLLRDAMSPNLVQTLENNLAFIHGGPFANIAHGCNSVVATRAAMKLADYVVTEAGFGADLGGEKFFNIKCRKTGLRPSSVVVVATVRALKLHGGVGANDLKSEDIDAVKRGLCNLERHLRNVGKFGVPAVVALNRFPTDTPAEIEAVQAAVSASGSTCVLAEHWEKGGAGATDLAAAVLDACAKPSDFKLLYPDDMPLRKKVETVAAEIYDASGVEFSSAAKDSLAQIEGIGYGHLPVCMAKTQYSFSDDQTAVGAPSGHTLHVREARLSAGAEFVVVIAGAIMTMPGLPKVPSAEGMHVNAAGDIIGLF